MTALRPDGGPQVPRSPEDFEALLRIGLDAAGEAGGLLASWRGDGRPEVVDTKSSPTDVVTEMDRKSEALIIERIQAIRPGDTVLGEEGGQTTGSSQRVRWVIDPLDGTVNYMYGLHDWAVSIAAEVDGEVVAGVVEVPRHGETFTAVVGRGAWLHRNGTSTALHCNTGVPLARALVSTGFGYDPGRRRVQGEILAAIMPHVRDIRRGGSAAVDLCSVAAGRLDGLYERGLNYWDYAAGGLIAREAGAIVGGLAGRPESTSMTVAAGPELFGPLEAFLTRLNPERDALRSQEQDGLPDPGGLKGTRRGRERGDGSQAVGRYRRAACAPGENVTEFPAGIGHNYGLESVTPAQRLRTTE